MQAPPLHFRLSACRTPAARPCASRRCTPPSPCSFGSSSASGLPRTGFSMHQLIMSRSSATRPSCTWYFGYVSGWVLAASGWHMSQDTAMVPPTASASWKTRLPSSTKACGGLGPDVLVALAERAVGVARLEVGALLLRPPPRRPRLASAHAVCRPRRPRWASAAWQAPPAAGPLRLGRLARCPALAGRGTSSQFASGFLRRHSIISALATASACSRDIFWPSFTPFTSMAVSPSHRPTTRLPSWRVGTLCSGSGSASAALGRRRARWRARRRPRRSSSTATPVRSFVSHSHGGRPRLVAGELGAGGHIRLAVGREVARAHGDRVAVPQVVDLVDQPGRRARPPGRRRSRRTG